VANQDIFCRLPHITSSDDLEWREWICPADFEQFITLIGANNANIAELLAILLGLLGQMTVPNERSAIDKQVVAALQAFAARTILSPANLYRIRAEVWTPLHRYHNASSISLDGLLQMSIMEIIVPKSDGQPSNLLAGFNLSKYTAAEWQLPDTVFLAGKHPFQYFIKKKHYFLLLGSIRGHDGAKEFKRTNLSLLKRFSTIKVGEALQRAGIGPLGDMLILHQSLREAIGSKQFSSNHPQEAEVLSLHHSYQKNLVAKQAAPCSFVQTKERLEKLGCCVRNYSNSRMVSLNEFAEGTNFEFIDRLSANNYGNAFDELIDQDRHQEALQLKNKIYKQLNHLPRIQLEALFLTILGYNHSQIAIHQKVSSCTVKRRRFRIISQVIDVSGKDMQAIDIAYLEVVTEYFLVDLATISRAQLQKSRSMLETTELVIADINDQWGLSLRAHERLQKALEKMFDREGWLNCISHIAQ
jgi:hypothetical protein